MSTELWPPQNAPHEQNDESGLAVGQPVPLNTSIEIRFNKGLQASVDRAETGTDGRGQRSEDQVQYFRWAVEKRRDAMDLVLLRLE